MESVKNKTGCFGNVPESQQWLAAEVAQQQNSDLQTLSSSFVCSLCARVLVYKIGQYLVSSEFTETIDA